MIKTIKFKKLDEKATIPTRAHTTDAGYDLVATSKCYINDILEYGTSIAVAIPEGYVGLLFPRSSVYKSSLSLCNCVGVIDSGYRGEIKLKYYMLNQSKIPFQVGDRVGQLLIVPIETPVFEEADELPESDRGENGFGSTGS